MISTAAPQRTDALLITQEGYDRLRQELRELTTDGRRAVAERLREARAHGGDPAENSELMAALEDRMSLDRRIVALNVRLGSARVVDDAGADGRAAVGTHVRLRGPTGDVAYALVGSGEAEPRRARISIDSPLGGALAGRRPGETVEVDTPRGQVTYAVLAVEPLDAPIAALAA
jgi:transcription elongation factor GreA